MKKGFTLIELLAVIVILAIIALIATPIILQIINNTKEEANKRSVEMFAKAVEKGLAGYQLNNTALSPGVYSKDTLPEDFEINYDGDIDCQTIGIGVNGNVYVANCETGGTQIEYTSGEKMYKNGEEVYFDVTKGEVCSNYHEDNSKTDYNGIYEGVNSTKTTENQNGCLKFYAFNDIGEDKVNLLLDHNTTAKIDWNTNNFVDGPITLINQLKTDTNEWKGTETLASYKDQYKEYIVNYDKARIITADEVAQITGNTELDSEKFIYSSFYFDSNTSTSSDTCKVGDTTGCKYGWLYDRTGVSCTTYGCLNNNNNTDTYTNGYWTVSAFNSQTYQNIWYVTDAGSMGNNGIAIIYYIKLGVRPVIEVTKTNLK